MKPDSVAAYGPRGIVEMSIFRESELRYLTGGQQLGRLATVGADGTPHVVPVAFIYNAARDTIDVGGYELERTKKFRDVARTERAAIVIDDLASTDPWHPRGIEIRGRGEAIALPTPLIRIDPGRIFSWGLERGSSARTVSTLEVRHSASTRAIARQETAQTNSPSRPRSAGGESVRGIFGHGAKHAVDGGARIRGGCDWRRTEMAIADLISGKATEPLSVRALVGERQTRRRPMYSPSPSATARAWWI